MVTQAVGDYGRMVWSPITHIPHKDVNSPSAFVRLSTGNGTALTLSGAHMIYVSDGASARRVPAPARDIQVCNPKPSSGPNPATYATLIQSHLFPGLIRRAAR